MMMMIFSAHPLFSPSLFLSDAADLFGHTSIVMSIMTKIEIEKKSDR